MSQVRLAVVLVAMLFFVGSSSSNANAQSEPKKEIAASAQIVFDVSIEALLKMPEFENVSPGKLIEFDSTESPFGSDFRLSDITRVSGAISLPKRVGDLTKVFFEEQFPFEFVVQIHFSDEAYVRNLGKYLASQKYAREKVDDVTMLRIPLPETKTSVLLRRSAKSTIAIGTQDFLSRTINEVISLDARKAWVNCGKGPVRIVGDLKSSHFFVNEIFQLVDFGQSHEQLEKVCQQSKAFSMSLLPDSGDLLQVGALSDSTKTASVLQKRMDFLSFEFRTAFNQALKPLCEEQDAEPIEIDGIATSLNQSEVTMSVAKPKNFPGILQAVISAANEESQLETEAVQAKLEPPAKQLTRK